MDNRRATPTGPRRGGRRELSLNLAAPTAAAESGVAARGRLSAVHLLPMPAKIPLRYGGIRSKSVASLHQFESLLLVDLKGDAQFSKDENTKMFVQKVADHSSARMNQSLEEREASPIIHLKKLNNWIKSVPIQLYARSGHVVLDLACGKGGDLIKWDKAKIGYYVGIEIAEGSDSAVGLLFALLPVLGGGSGMLLGLLSMAKLLLVLSLYLSATYFLTWSFIPRFLNLMVQLSSEVILVGRVYLMQWKTGPPVNNTNFLPLSPSQSMIE